MSSSSCLSVVVVGAGAAGLRLAQTLLTESPTPIDVTILEANDYCGGRVRHSSFEGHTVELGANWISGLETAFDNPIWRLAKKNRLRSNPSNREDRNRLHVIDCTADSGKKSVTSDSGSGGPVITDLYLKRAKEFDEIYAQAVEEVDSSSSSVSFGKDVDVRSLLHRNGWSPKSSIDHAIEHNLLEVWVAEELNLLSAIHDMKSGANDVDLGQDEVFVEDPRGFRSIFDAIVQELTNSKTTTIQLMKEVQEIQYQAGDTKVVAKDLRTGQIEEYNADIVVSTVSLGVLQNDCIRFHPSLPKWKVDALNQVGMFNFAKVFAKFKKPLCPDGVDYLVLVGHNKGHYPLWMRYKHSEEPIMMCYVGGAEARRIESMDEGALMDEIEDLFGKAFGHSGDCRPVKVAVTDWSTNPRFHGSYSYFPAGAFASLPLSHFLGPLSGLDEERVSPVTSLPKSLYFAGEAFDDKYNGWVQGGYLSGERVARAILKEHLDS